MRCNIVVYVLRVHGRTKKKSDSDNVTDTYLMLACFIQIGTSAQLGRIFADCN